MNANPPPQHNSPHKFDRDVFLKLVAATGITAATVVLGEALFTFAP